MFQRGDSMDGKRGLTIVLSIIAVSMSLFHIYTGVFGSMEAILQRSLHLTFALPLVFLMYPALKGQVTRLNFTNIALVILSFCPGLYIYFEYDRISTRWAYTAEVTTLDFMMGALLVILLLEAARRIMGLVMTILCGAFLAYGFLGQYLPGALGHGGTHPLRVIEYLFLTTEGIYGTALGTSATFVVLFVIFGAFLKVSGSGKFFMDLALTLTGKTRGGPAKVGVVASSLFGTISGAAVANVYATGTFTIPLMKRIGYKPRFAGAVEAVSSTGGQLMPPIMGSAAFIMADMLGVSILTVMKAALIPAVLYFVSVYIIIHLEALKLGLEGLKDDEIPKTKNTLKKSFLLAPILAIVIVLMLGYSATFAALSGIGLCIIVSQFTKETRIGVKDLIEGLVQGAKGSVLVAIATAAAGIIVGVATQTGLGFKFTSYVTSFSDGNLWVAGILVMMASIIVGMGLPSVAAFIMVAALTGPALIELGVEPLAAYMFVFYYCAISTITPPVALSAFAAASISGSEPFRTGFSAMRLGLVAFLVPFMFLYSGELLLEGIISNIILAAVTALIGAITLGAGLQGWLIRKCTLIERILLFVAALTTLNPGLITDIVGLGFLGLVLLLQKLITPNFKQTQYKTKNI